MLDVDSALESSSELVVGRLGESIRRAGGGGEALVLVIPGHGELVVRDRASLEQLLALVDGLEQIDEVRDRVREFAAGKPGLSLEEAKEHARRKYGISL